MIKDFGRNESTSLDWQVKSLKNRLNGVSSGFCNHALAIVGEAGLGKSFTVQTVLQNLTCAAIRVKATESLTDLLGRLSHFGQVNLEPSVGTVVSGETEPALSNKKILSLIRARLIALAPIVIQIEDLNQHGQHWLDLVKAIQGLRGIAILATSRESLPRSFVEIRLRPMNQTQIRALLEHHGYALPPEAIAWIQSRVAGNPRFALEYCTQLGEIGALRNHFGIWQWSEPTSTLIPLGLQSQIRADLEGLVDQISDPQKAKLVLMTRALVSKDVLPDHAVPAFVGMELQSEIESVLLRNFGSANGFDNPLYPEVIRQDLWNTERRLVARTLLEPVSAINPSAAIGLLYAAQLESSAELAAWQLIAEQANRQRALSLAGACFVAALELCAGTLKADLASRASRCLRRSSRAKSLQLMNLAISIAPENESYQLEWCRAVLVNGQYDQAKQYLQQKDFQNPLWLALQLQTLFRGGEDQAGLKLWRQHQAQQPLLCEVTQLQTASALLRQGQHQEAFGLLGQQKSAARDAMTAAGCRQLGHTQEALLLLEQALQNDLTTSEREALVHQRALVFQTLGQLSAAQTDAETALELLQTEGDEFRLAVRKNTLASIMIEKAEFESAEQLLLESRRIIGLYGHSRQLVSIERNLAWLYLEWQPEMGGALALKHARNALRQARSLCGTSELHEHLAFIAWAEALHGDPQHALTLILETPCDSALNQWVHLLCLEQLGHQDVQTMFETWLTTQEKTPRTQRYALELDRIRNDADNSYFEIQNNPEPNPLAAHVLKRYFPEQPLRIQNTTSEKLEVLGLLRINGIGISGRLRRAKEFLLCLLEARIVGQPEVSLLELIDYLYPNEDEHQASSAIRQLVYRLRKTYGENTILRGLHGYILGIPSDAEEFLSTNNTRLWRGTYQGDSMLLQHNSSVSEVLHQNLEQCIENLHDPVEAARVKRFIAQPEKRKTQPQKQSNNARVFAS
jgi:tetratricopeptide (TPR) repeat protein